MNLFQNGMCVWEIQNEEGFYIEVVYCCEFNIEVFLNLEDFEIKDIV